MNELEQRQAERDALIMKLGWSLFYLSEKYNEEFTDEDKSLLDELMSHSAIRHKPYNREEHHG